MESLSSLKERAKAMINQEKMIQMFKDEYHVAPVSVLADDMFMALHSVTENNHGKWIQFDIYEEQNNQINHILHTQTELLSELTPSGHTQIDGTVHVNSDYDTEQTRSTVRHMINETAVGGSDMTHAREFVSDDYVQHHVGIPDGADLMIKGMKMLKTLGKESNYHSVNYLIAQGDFALSISEGEASGIEKMYYDLFRVKNGMIVEHWDIVEKV